MIKKSLQLRIAIMTSILISISCLVMMFLLRDSGLKRIDEIGKSLEKPKILEHNIDFSDTSRASFDPSKPQKDKNLTIVIGEAREKFTLNIWYITATVTLISGFIAYFVSGRALKPLEDFSNQVSKVQLTNLEDMHIDTDTMKEFQSLAKSFNDMLDRLYRSFAAQKQFTGNAAHELRTPLSLLQMRLETFETQHPNLNIETRDLVNSLKIQIDNLASTLKTLLEMTSLQNIPRNEKISLLPMLDEILTDLSPLAEKKDITLKCSGDDVEITGSDTMLARLFFNITENAIKYGRNGGHVSIDVKKMYDKIIIKVADSGYGIAKNEWKSIFQPFYRLDSSRSKKVGGVGLGLALASEIASLHGGSIKVLDSSNSGTIMMIELPS